ncbi:uncharacterized protein LOC115233047 [Formica exsecta]|uniref:uncharacterized protein LOC115233047 n=1 Tax=Formica exsecta TaxID=72781 RepID=UPI0011438782|nr:uncharacterized protein LOC115233047 [Formica exsecta]
MDNVATLITDIHLANRHRKFTGIVFLDLVGTFDNVLPEALLILLEKFGLPKKIIGFIRKTTTNRYLTGYAAGIPLQTRRTDRGLPQGSILSPILFNIYVALAHTCLPEHLKILMYANDIAIYHMDDNLDSIKCQLGITVERLKVFFGRLGLKIAPEKSTYTTFSSMKPRNLRVLLRKNNFFLKLDNTNILISWSPRFLGIYLDSELKWRAHINKLKNRTIPRINILKAISGIKWGAHPNILLTIYKGFIRPLLDWGCQVFHPLDEALYLKTSRLQFAALRTVTGIMCTTPINVLLDINGEQPLASRWQYLTEKLICKIKARTTHPLHYTLEQIAQDPANDQYNFESLINTFMTHQHLFNQIETFKLPGYLEFKYHSHQSNPQIDVDIGFGLINRPNIQDKFIQFTNSNIPSSTKFYTDGSRLNMASKARYAIYSPDLNLKMKRRINDNCSIFQAETLAISHTLDIILERKINNSAIFTDSLSVLSGLNNSAWSGKTHNWILKIRHSLYNCQTNNIMVKLFWIPSHKGIYGNEQADLLAKESLHLPNHLLMSKCHYSNIYSKVKKLAKDKATQTLRPV